MRETFPCRALLLLVLILLATSCGSESPRAVFQAAAAAVDVTPPRLPVIVNGMFEERKADAVTDPQYARALVLDEGAGQIALVVVDNLMIPQEIQGRYQAALAR